MILRSEPVRRRTAASTGAIVLGDRGCKERQVPIEIKLGKGRGIRTEVPLELAELASGFALALLAK